jgi:hypothetical protein
MSACGLGREPLRSTSGTGIRRRLKKIRVSLETVRSERSEQPGIPRVLINRWKEEPQTWQRCAYFGMTPI